MKQLLCAILFLLPLLYMTEVQSEVDQDNGSWWDDKADAVVNVSKVAVSSGVRRQMVFNAGGNLSRGIPHRAYYAPRGSAFLNTVLPGDTLVLPDDTSDLIDIGGLHGTAERPITIVAQKPVRFMRVGTDSAVTHVKIYGITYTGYLANGTEAGVTLSCARVSDIWIDSNKVLGGKTGIMIKVIADGAKWYSVKDRWVMRNIKVTRNFLHNIGGEGFYFGHTSPDHEHNGTLPTVRGENIEVALNIIDGTDWDGIQVSNFRGDAKIHHNIVHDFGRSNISPQRAGIILGGNTTGDVYSNTVSCGTGNGIQVFGYGPINIHSNTIDSVGLTGTLHGVQSIFANDYVIATETNPKQKISIYNNYIKNPRPAGAIKLQANNRNNEPAMVSNNTFCIPNAPADWLRQHIILDPPGSTKRSNKLNCEPVAVPLAPKKKGGVGDSKVRVNTRQKAGN